MSKAMDITGQKYGKLTAVSYQGWVNNVSLWLCKCDCGKEVILPIAALRSGNTKSCGCLKKELISKKSTKHSMHKTTIYQKYQDMIRRCYNKNAKRYERYGGRGIKVCEEWLPKNNGFINFYNWAIANGYKPYDSKRMLRNQVLTLDRINCDGDYEPSNCRFVRFKVQENNKCNNVYVFYEGERYTLKELSEKFDISYSTVERKYHKGLDAEAIVKGYSRLPANYDNRGRLGTLPNWQQKIYNKEHNIDVSKAKILRI